MENEVEDHRVLKEELKDGVKVVYVCKLNAHQRYYMKNREEINRKVAEWRRNKYANDVEFRERQRETRRRYNERKRIEKSSGKSEE